MIGSFDDPFGPEPGDVRLRIAAAVPAITSSWAISPANKARSAALDWYVAPYDPDEIGEQQIVATLSRITNTSRPSR
jgi:hypothetical protein